MTMNIMDNAESQFQSVLTVNTFFSCETCSKISEFDSFSDFFQQRSGHLCRSQPVGYLSPSWHQTERGFTTINAAFRFNHWIKMVFGFRQTAFCQPWIPKTSRHRKCVFWRQVFLCLKKCIADFVPDLKFWKRLLTFCGVFTRSTLGNITIASKYKPVQWYF